MKTSKASPFVHLASLLSMAQHCREANTTVPAVPPSPAPTVASTLSENSISSHMRSLTIHHTESEASSSNGSPKQGLNRSVTAVPRHTSRAAGSTPSRLFEPFKLNANSRPPRTPMSSLDSWDDFGRRSESSWYNLSRNGDATSVSESAMQHPLNESDDDRLSSPSHELVCISCCSVEISQITNQRKNSPNEMQ